jgi:hypothetical protein
MDVQCLLVTNKAEKFLVPCCAQYVFGPKRDEVTGEWRRLYNEELNDLYCTPKYSRDQIKNNEIGVACSTYMYGGEEGCIQGFSGET